MGVFCSHVSQLETVKVVEFSFVTASGYPLQMVYEIRMLPSLDTVGGGRSLQGGGGEDYRVELRGGLREGRDL